MTKTPEQVAAEIVAPGFCPATGRCDFGKGEPASDTCYCAELHAKIASALRERDAQHEARVEVLERAIQTFLNKQKDWHDKHGLPVKFGADYGAINELAAVLSNRVQP